MVIADTSDPMLASKKYIVRQYRPNFVTGFENSVVHGLTYEEIPAIPWADNFKHSGFSHFTVSPYEGELIIEAHYTDGKHWVVGFALPEDSEIKAPDGGLLRDNWRYKAGIVA